MCFRAAPHAICLKPAPEGPVALGHTGNVPGPPRPRRADGRTPGARITTGAFSRYPWQDRQRTAEDTEIASTAIRLAAARRTSAIVQGRDLAESTYSPWAIR